MPIYGHTHYLVLINNPNQKIIKLIGYCVCRGHRENLFIRFVYEEGAMKHRILALLALLALTACGGGGGGGGGDVTLTTGADGRVGNIPSTVTILPTANTN